MDKKNLKLKNNFTQLIGQVSNLYKEVSNQTNEAYLLGKKEALEEVLNWFITSHNGELKYISANSFFNMIQEKLTKTKTALATRGAEDAENEIKHPVNFAEIKIADNRKRVNRYSYSDQNEQIVVEDEVGNQNGQTNSNNTSNAHQMNFPFSVNSIIRSANPIPSSNAFLLGQGNSINSTPNQNNNQPSLLINPNTSTPNEIIPQNNFNNLGINSLSTQSNNIFGSIQTNLFAPNKKKKK